MTTAPPDVRPLVAGERVLLVDPKGRRHLTRLVDGGVLHTHRGGLSHDELIGGPEGVVVVSEAGTPYLALRPTLSEVVVLQKRAATVMYPKDLGGVLVAADVGPGMHVVEAGAGSGALSCALLRAVGEHGRVSSYEVREDHAEVARRNVEDFFGAVPPHWSLEVRDVVEALVGADGPRGADRMVLDLLAPWEVLDAAATALRPGGVLCCYVTTTTQLSSTVEGLRAAARWTEPRSLETLERTWHVEGLAVRPDHRMVGHTGFLVTSRLLAPGVAPPPVRRRPAPGRRRGG